MPTIEETIDDIIRRLDENVVIVGGIRHDTNTALTTANLAVSNIAGVRVNVRGYTDQRIQEVYDFFADTLETWAQSILATAGAYTDGVGSDVGTGISNDLDDWKTSVQSVIDDILADYEDLTRWAEDTYDVEIPAIMQLVNDLTEDVRQAEQDILNEVGTSRQEIAEMASRWRELASQIQEHRNAILEMDYSIYEVKDEIYRGISAEFDGRFANFDERIVVAAGVAGAVADRVSTLEVEYGDQSSMVQNLERAMIDGDEQLALHISALSVGNNTQFDSARIWHFNENTEDWSGTWIDGYLDVHETVQSGTISINASQYRQVRARIQRVGAPTWDGYLNWTGATPAGPETIPEPSWIGNFGEFTVNIPWSGTLTRISLSLGISTEPDPVNNYYRIDWVSVGRPSPGASTADITTERIARINADGLLAARIDNLEGNFTSIDGFTEAVTNIIDGVKTEITEDATTGAVTALNERITMMETNITNLETGQTANTSAISTLVNRVTLSEDELVAVNSRIDNFEVNADDVINSQAYQGLVQRVNVAEGSIATVNSDITTLNTSVSAAAGNASTAQSLAQNAANLAGSKGKVFVQDSAPPVAERLEQNLWIDTTGDANTPKRWNQTNNAWEAVTDKVARDAAAAAAAALAGLGDKADSSALSALSNRVTVNEDKVEAQAQSLVALNSSVTTVSGNVNAAQQAAQDAMNTANSKGQVIYQSATPATQFRLPQNLWIDTTNNNNTPKRWNGTAWVSVTDKVALDAAAAAAAAMNAIATKADASAVSLLTTRVTQTEGSITSLGQNITRIDNSISVVSGDVVNAQTAAQNAMDAAGSKGEVIYGNSAPSANKRLTQNLWIDTNGGNNTPKRWNGTAWIAVTDKVARDAATAAAQAQASVETKAEASTVNALTQTVNQQGNTLTSTTNRVNTVENRINNTNTGLSALSQKIDSTNTSVTQVGNTVTAQGNSIDALTSSVGNYSAGGLFRVRTVATPTGALSRIAIAATAFAGEGDTRRAGIYLEAIAGNYSRVLVEASRFAIVQNADDGEPSVPFFIQNGITYIKAAYIPNLAVDTLKIADNAVSTLITKTTAATLSITPSQGSNWVNIQNITINKERSDALPIILSARFNILNTNQGSWVYGRVRVGSTIIWQGMMGSNLNWYSDDNFMVFNETIVDTTTAIENRNYIWEATCYGGSTMPVLNRTMIGIVLLK